MLILGIQNISQCKPTSDYKYTVYINKRVIAEGIVRKHKRKDGWTPLVKRILEQEEGNDQP